MAPEAGTLNPILADLPDVETKRTMLQGARLRRLAGFPILP